jgi:hypothetical protein
LRARIEGTPECLNYLFSAAPEQEIAALAARELSP